MKRLWLLLPAVCLTSGCGSFRQPPLPRGAAGAAAPENDRDQVWATKLRAADAVYFSLTRSSKPNDGPAWQIATQMQRGGAPVALGWAEIPADQQPLFDQWRQRQISDADLLERIVRPQSAVWLEHALRPDFAQAALGCSRELLDKIRRGEMLTADERAQLPTGFHPRAEAFENFVEQATASARLRRYDVRRLFRAHLMAEETIAENIVRFRREKPTTKLLIFLPNDLMIDPREIAAFVAQKLPLRQLILDRTRPLEETKPLLTRARSFRVEIVNRAPGAAVHDRRSAAPRLLA